MMGMRPIVEIMWIDFSLVAMDQIVNQIANAAYVSRGEWRAPLVIRTQQGYLPGACAQHAQNLEAFYAHTPGLRVGMPYSVQDAHDMLLSAVESPDPVMIIENRSLYFRAKEPVRLDKPVEPIGRARIVRRGRDATVVTWSAMVGVVSEAAEVPAAEGIDVEVIDLRWINPWTRRPYSPQSAGPRASPSCMRANQTGGFGAELVARVAEQCLYDLDAPPRRIATPDMRIPSAPHLQRAVIPQVSTVVEGLRALVRE